MSRGRPETRAAVIEAAARLLDAHGYHGFGLEQVAADAGVTRQAVYYLFESKQGLLDAVVESLLATAGVERWIEEVLGIDDADAALRTWVRRQVEMWDQVSGVARALVGLAATDAEAASVLARHDEGRRRAVARLVAKLAAARRLSPRVGEERATRALWLLTGFETYDALRTKAGLPSREVIATLSVLAAGLLRSA